VLKYVRDWLVQYFIAFAYEIIMNSVVCVVSSDIYYVNNYNIFNNKNNNIELHVCIVE